MTTMTILVSDGCEEAGALVSFVNHLQASAFCHVQLVLTGLHYDLVLVLVLVHVLVLIYRAIFVFNSLV